MKLTPLDIHHKEFRRGIRGYNEEEVDVFLDQVAEEFERVFKENIELKEQVEGMKNKVTQYEGVEHSLQKALLTAQQAADQVESSAKKESELIVKDAEIKAKEIIQQVLTEKQNLQNELSALKSAEREFREKFKSLLSQYLDVISKVENGDKLAEEPPVESASVYEVEPEVVEDIAEEPAAASIDTVVDSEPANQETEVEPEEPAAQVQSVEEAAPENDFSAMPRDVGGASFFGDRSEIKMVEEVQAAPWISDATANEPDTEIKVTLGEPLEVKPNDDLSEVIGDIAPTIVAVTPPETSEPEVPEFNPLGGSGLTDPAPPSVSSFFDDDLGVDEEAEEKKDWSMAPEPADDADLPKTDFDNDKNV